MRSTREISAGWIVRCVSGPPHLLVRTDMDRPAAGVGLLVWLQTADHTKQRANALFGERLGYQVRDCDASDFYPAAEIRCGP